MTRIVAIIAQGPKTMRRYSQGMRYARVIGVNAVPCYFACDYWASSDYSTFVRYIDGCDDIPPVIGEPVLVTRPPCIGQMRDQSPEVYARVSSRIVSDEAFPIHRGCTYSGLLALSLAHSLSPDRIECFGCDMDGSRDFLGRNDNKNRQPTRWGDERKDWTRMAKQIEADGCEVWHADPDGSGVFRWIERYRDAA